VEFGFGVFHLVALTLLILVVNPAMKGLKRRKWLKWNAFGIAGSLGDSVGTAQESGGKPWDFRGKAGTTVERDEISGEHAAQRGNGPGQRENALGQLGNILGFRWKRTGQRRKIPGFCGNTPGAEGAFQVCSEGL
jgi:hypothetical protein